MMWNDQMISEALRGIDTIAYVPGKRASFGSIRPTQIQPASLDVRLGDEFIRHTDGSRVRSGAYTMMPGECLLAVLVERLRLRDDLVARIEGKSSLARQFLTVHSAGFIDPGFQGDVTLELKNDGRRPLHLKAGMLIAQISFQSLAAPALRPYGTPGLNSHYQGQKGPTLSC